MVRADLAGAVDAELIASQQGTLATATSGLTGSLERGLPTEAPREEFAAVAAAGRPVYDHLDDVGFFSTTTEAVPEFTSAFLESLVQGFVGSEALTDSLASISFDGTAGADLIFDRRRER